MQNVSAIRQVQYINYVYYNYRAISLVELNSHHQTLQEERESLERCTEKEYQQQVRVDELAQEIQQYKVCVYRYTSAHASLTPCV